MSLASELAVVVMSFILREAPTLRDKPVEHAKYVVDVTSLVGLHDEIADGRLINHDMDTLLLTAVNYRESRLRNPSVDGDCHMQHRLQDVPSALWPKDYKPVYVMNCNAVGPMQLAKGHRGTLQRWLEIVTEFGRDRGWDFADEKSLKQNPFTLDDLRDPRTNIRIAYAELQHWKGECRDSGGADAPVGVWLTAYRYGKCPPRGKSSGRFYIDSEAKARCAMVQKMANKLKEEAFDEVTDLRCGY